MDRIQREVYRETMKERERDGVTERRKEIVL